jgi:hypothetical protein
MIREYLEMFFALILVGFAALTGFIFIILCTPWPWIAGIIYILANNL